MTLDGFNAAALLLELWPKLENARLQKFSQLTEVDFLLHFRVPGNTHKLIISLHHEKSRFHLLQAGHPPAIVPSSFVMLARKRVGGTRLVELRQHGLDRSVEFVFSSEFSLIFDWAGRPPSLLLTQTEGHKIVGLFPPRGRFRLGQEYEPEEQAKPSPLSFTPQQARSAIRELPADTDIRDALEQVSAWWSPLWKNRFRKRFETRSVGEVGDEQLEEAWSDFFAPLKGEQPLRPALHSDGALTYCAAEPQFPTMHEAANELWKESSRAPGVHDFRQDLVKQLKKSKEKAERKLKKRKQDQKGALTADRDQLRGDLLLAYAGQLKRGSEKFETHDWEGKPVSIPLDKRLTATENADRFYNKAKKKRRALKVLGEQIALAEEEIEMWEELLYAAESADDRTDLEQVRQSIPRPQKSGKKRKIPEVPSSGPRRYRHHDFQILVGRNPAQNEKLSMRTAAKDDHWFHVREGAGSHVLIRAAGAEPPESTKLAAAWLAAHYSKSSESRTVGVITTRARFLKKPKGGPLGKVIYRSETEIVVDPTSPQPEGLEEE